jgi:predicted Zn-dependent protease
VLLVLAIAEFVNRVKRRDAQVPRIVPLAIASLLVIVLGVTTAVQNTEFSSSERLWRGSLEHWPSALAHRNLAAVLLQQGRRSEALDHLREAATRQPLAHYELGVALFDDGRPADAIAELEHAIRELPNDETVALEGRRVLARALKQEGQHHDASIVFGEIAALTPGDVEPRLSQADELLAAGDLTAAHDEYQRILAAQPDHAGAMTNDGLTLLRLGRVSEALPLLRTVAERQPQSVSASLNFASAAAAAGRLADATTAVCHAIAEAPADPAARQFFADLQHAAQAAGLERPRCPAR